MITARIVWAALAWLTMLAHTGGAVANTGAEAPVEVGATVPSKYSETAADIVTYPTESTYLEEFEPIPLAMSPALAKSVVYGELQALMVLDAQDNCFRLPRKLNDGMSRDPAPDPSDCKFMKLVRAEHRRSTGCDKPPAEAPGFDFGIYCTYVDDRWILVSTNRRGERYALAYFKDKPILFSFGILHDRVAIFGLIATEQGKVFITHYLLHPRSNLN